MSTTTLPRTPGDVIPVVVRTARKRLPCDDSAGTCGGTIEPGERYEDHRLPPHREPNEGSRWWKIRIHHPTLGRAGGGPAGCELAAAYREAARLATERAALSRATEEVPA